MVKHSKQLMKLGKRGRATSEYKDKQNKGQEIDANLKDLALLSERAEDKRVNYSLVSNLTLWSSLMI